MVPPDCFVGPPCGHTRPILCDQLFSKKRKNITMFYGKLNAEILWAMVCGACQWCAWLFIGFKTVCRDGTTKQCEKPKKMKLAGGGLGPPFEMYCGRPWFSFLGCPEAARGTTFLNHSFGGFGCFGRVRLFVTVQARTVAPNWASRRLSLCDQLIF